MTIKPAKITTSENCDVNSSSSSTTISDNNIPITDSVQGQLIDNSSLNNDIEELENSNQQKTRSLLSSEPTTAAYKCPSENCESTQVEQNSEDYNSDDEYDLQKQKIQSEEIWKKKDELFEKCMLERGFIIKKISEDGACLFRAISLQIYGDEGMHDEIRKQTMEHIQQNRDYYSNFITEEFDNYVERKRNQHCHGNHIEIQAMSEIYNRPIEVYRYRTSPINIFNGEKTKEMSPPLRLSYHRNSHYNAVIDPFSASVGVGLGLSGYKPNLQTKDAIQLSEELEIEKIMLQDKLQSTDCEEVQKQIENQMAHDSYLQYCRDLKLKSSKATGESSSNSKDIVSSSETNLTISNNRNSTISLNGSIRKYKGYFDLNNAKNNIKRKSKENSEWNSKRSKSLSPRNVNISFDWNAESSKNNNSEIDTGASCSNVPSTSIKNNDISKQISQFHQSLLESSFTGKGSIRLSESEMIAKAIEMSITCLTNKSDAQEEKKI